MLICFQFIIPVFKLILIILGTHGHMKCFFDGMLKSQDTVLMNLYKRMFPKWTYDPYVKSPPSLYHQRSRQIEENEDSRSVTPGAKKQRVTFL